MNKVLLIAPILALTLSACNDNKEVAAPASTTAPAVIAPAPTAPSTQPDTHLSPNPSATDSNSSSSEIHPVETPPLSESNTPSTTN